jgi:hypothetical protein
MCSFFRNFFELTIRRKYILNSSILFTVNYYFFKKILGIKLINNIMSRLLTNYYLISNIIPTSRILALCASKA